MITTDQIKQLKPGDQVNSSTGVVTILDIGSKYVTYRDAAGQTDRWYTCVLQACSLNLTSKFCGYCGAELKPGEWEERRIWRNGGTEDNCYCKGKQCASYAQMSAEG